MAGLLEILRFEQVIVHTGRGHVTERLGLQLCEIAANSNTFAEKAKHVVSDNLYRFAGFHIFKIVYVVHERTDVLQASLRFLWNDMNRKSTTAEVVAEWRWWVQNKPTTCNQLPAFFNILLFADYFEIVDVD